MVLTEIQTAVREIGGFSTDTDTAQEQAIAQVYAELASERPWLWTWTEITLTLTAGDEEKASGVTDFRLADSARIIYTTPTPPEITPLEYIDLQKFADLSGATATSWPSGDRDIPEYWSYTLPATGAPTFRVWPQPDLAYTLHVAYYKNPAALTDGTAPLFSPAYHDIIVWGVIKRLAMRQRDREFANYAEKEYTARYNQMVSDDVKQKQTGLVVEPWDGWAAYNAER